MNRPIVLVTHLLATRLLVTRQGHKLSLVATCSLLVLALSACGARPATPSAPSTAPKQVAFTVVQPQRLPIVTDLPGRVAPTMIAEVRPQVNGLIKARLFTEGSSVKAGEVLYEIDPATYQAVVDSEAAALEKAQAKLNVAKLKAARTNELVAIKAVSLQDADDADASLKEANADLLSARAALQSARIDLEHTRIKSPISGRIGRSSVTPGALITANQAASLATVQKLDPINVDVTLASSVLLRLKQLMANGQVQPGAAKVRLLLDDGQTYSRQGTLKFSEVTVESSTSSVTLRAEFPNPDSLLLPGMYVRAVVEAGVIEQALLVPQRAVTRDPQGEPMAYVINAANKLEARKLVTPRAFGNQWLVSAGLKPGDHLAVKGFESVPPDTEVAPQLEQAPPYQQTLAAPEENARSATSGTANSRN